MIQIIPKVKHIIVFLFIFLPVLFILLKILDGIHESKSENIVSHRSLKFPEDVEHASIILNQAYKKIEDLEDKIISLEGRVPKTYPDVKFLNYMQRKRILITGGAGFVGSHLVDKLMLEGHEVIVADNFYTGRKLNVEQWIGHENFELIHHDIVNPLYIEVDDIYHLASPASPPHYMRNPVKTIKTNTLGTINVLGLARRLNAKVLIASTSEVYGDPDIHPQPETYWGHVNPIGPRACYDEGKRVSESLTYAYAKQENMQVRVARIFNTYGPRMHMNDGRAVSNFILQALQEDVITVYGSGDQTRSFQYVSDLVEGLVALMNSNYSQPVNLGNPIEHTINVSECMTQGEIDKHLELGKQYLAKGQLGDALSQYHLAVEGDPNNYLTYFKRGTVYLALGKAKNALSDLDRVLELKPDFLAARISRGNIHLKQANYDLAQLDFYNVLKHDPYNAEANDYIHRIDPAKEKKRSAEYYYGHNDYATAIHYLTEVIEISPWASDLYEFRSELHMLNGDEVSAVSDLRASTKLQSDNTDGYLKLSQLLYKSGQATEALKAIRECLKLDPEHKGCFPFYKSIKKIEKFITDAETALENKEYSRCIESANKVIKNEKDTPSIIYEAKRILCSCYSYDEQSSEAITVCSEALAYHDDPNIYCDRAEAYLNSELYDDAIRDYRAAIEIDSHFERAKEGLQKAENRQKQAEKRDYYKILEVKRSATKKEIVKAYRKMAQKWHPDNYQNDEKMKKIAEKRFIDIAAAKEVLTDEEKRKQFDNGEDPLDPESGRGGMPNFHHFQSFHGSPFQFKFHFN